MNLKDIAKSVGGLGADVLSSGLLGPGGAMVGALIGKTLGLDDTASDFGDQLKSAMTSPENQVRIMELETQYKLEQERIAASIAEAKLFNERELYARDTEDRSSARNMRMALPLDKTPMVLAYMAIAAFFLVVGALVFVDLPASGKDLLFVAVGTLGTIVTQVYAFHFGSSAGSKSKDITMAAELAQDDN